MEFCLIHLIALIASVSAMSLNSGSSSNSIDVRLLEAQKNNDGNPKALGAWSSSQNWYTGDLWNINAIWQKKAYGVSYQLLSNPSNWYSWRVNHSLNYSEITKCNVWTSYKATFNKNYVNQKDEINR
jgi:hypothetical protein